MFGVRCSPGFKTKAAALMAAALAILNTASAQVPANVTVVSAPKVVASSSGQFIVNTRNSLSPRTLEIAAQADLLALDPALLAVSCDRIKAELLRQLNMPDAWRGRIFVSLHPVQAIDEKTTVVSEKFAGRWQCIVDLPDAVDRNRFVETIVRATLLEIANRSARTQGTEIPEWLVRGFGRQLLGISEVKLILQPPRKFENGVTVTRTTLDFSDTPRASRVPTQKLNPLTQAASVLRTNEPLSFDQLSWPTEEQLSETGTDLYSSSAQLFVSRLLHEKGGQECFRALLAELPDYLNWQLAFEHAFQPLFKDSLDVEKWWALQITDFSGRDLLHLLTPQESATQLDAVFQFPIHVQIGMSAPMRTGISLQTIIRGWSRTQQLQILKSKIWELGALRMRISPDYIPLVDQYLAVLQEYCTKRGKSVRILAALGLDSDKFVDEALMQLDRLDVQRVKMRPEVPTAVVSAASSVEP